MPVIIFVALWLFSMVAWIAHIIVCIKYSLWVLLVVGVFIPPIGMIHGFGILFNIF